MRHAFLHRQSFTDYKYVPSRRRRGFLCCSTGFGVAVRLFAKERHAVVMELCHKMLDNSHMERHEPEGASGVPLMGGGTAERCAVRRSVRRFPPYIDMVADRKPARLAFGDRDGLAELLTTIPSVCCSSSAELGTSRLIRFTAQSHCSDVYQSHRQQPFRFINALHQSTRLLWH